MQKNIIFVLMSIIIILGGATIAKNKLIDLMTEYNTDYQLVVKK